jgi:putative ABC transport system ATP-binding protein
MSSTPIIAVRGLGKTVRLGQESLTILEGIDLQVNTGETLALVGASGSGKSTLLGLLAGLDLPSSGEIEILGHSLTRLDEEGRARLRAEQVGFVFQSFLLLPTLSALETSCCRPSCGETERAPCPELLAQVGLGERLHHLPPRLSGGEQQRVAIARAFMTRPSLLLADEPTGNLDSKTGETVIELLFRLNREHNTTLVVVTHDHELAQRCQRQLVMSAGRLEAQAVMAARVGSCHESVETELHQGIAGSSMDGEEAS